MCVNVDIREGGREEVEREGGGKEEGGEVRINREKGREKGER